MCGPVFLHDVSVDYCILVLWGQSSISLSKGGRGSREVARHFRAILLLQRIQFRFPAPPSGYSQWPVTPAPRDPVPSAGLFGTCTHMHIQIYTNKESFLLLLLLRFLLFLFLFLLLLRKEGTFRDKRGSLQEWEKKTVRDHLIPAVFIQKTFKYLQERNTFFKRGWTARLAWCQPTQVFNSYSKEYEHVVFLLCLF